MLRVWASARGEDTAVKEEGSKSWEEWSAQGRHNECWLEARRLVTLPTNAPLPQLPEAPGELASTQQCSIFL